MTKLFLISLLLFLSLGVFSQDKGVYQYQIQSTVTDLNIFYSAPKIVNQQTRLVVVMHGRKRNGEEYRNQWIDKANELNLLVIVPEYPEKDFPGVFGFNYGNIFDANGIPTNRSLFNDIQSLVSDAMKKFELTSSRWGIYGHGAGAHFVHRLVLHKPDLDYTLAIAANLGWYLTPHSNEWPFGLKNSGITNEDLKKAYNKYFLLLLGKSDLSTKPNTAYVASIFDKVSAQGMHRLERGRNFFKDTIKKARSMDVFLKWGMVEVPTKDGHSNTQQMVPYAAELFYERLR